MADDHSPERGRNYKIDALLCDLPQEIRKLPAQKFSVFRVLEDQSGLKISRTVQPTGEAEMTFQVSAGLLEQIECSHCRGIHNRYYSVDKIAGLERFYLDARADPKPKVRVCIRFCLGARSRGQGAGA
jgi:hypothetical protein